jgi:nucleoside-diphosphate-sugar epimerase
MEPSIQHALVTGGAGFIGSHLVDRLVAQGTRVTVIDNLSTGRAENLDHSRAHIRFFHGDICDSDLLGEAIAGCDVVFHLAAVVSVTETVDDPLTSAAVNDQGTLAVLEAARTQGCARVVLSSSCAVYGDDPRMPKDEKMHPKPMSPYAVQKLAGELYAGVYQGLFGLETVCLRYFNVYGPRQDPSSPYSGVISIFMSQALNRQPVTIYGDGLQCRDFIYVKDVFNRPSAAACSTSARGAASASTTYGRPWRQLPAGIDHRSMPHRAAVTSANRWPISSVPGEDLDSRPPWHLKRGWPRPTPGIVKPLHSRTDGVAG